MLLNPSRRTFLLLVVCATLLLAERSRAEPTELVQNRYNVLFIAIDDLRPELKCYGVEHASSEHLDRFARTALLFDRHYVQVATCGASRYAMLTGRSPANSNVTAGNDAFYSGETKFSDKQLAGVQSMPELFRRSGYQTSLIGKISHTADGLVYAYDGSGDGRLEMPLAWTELLTPLGSWKRGWGVFFAYADGHHREDGNGHRDLWQFTAQNDEDLPDGQNAASAIQQLQKYKQTGERFFMGLGFYKPHLPFVAPQQDWDAMADVDIPAPAPEKIDSQYWHKSGEFYNYDATHEKTSPLSDVASLQCKRAYNAAVRYVDRQVGKVLTELQQLELDRETIVVVWGDHGWHLGEQQIWGKHSPFERANRSALMIRVPEMRTAGRRTKSLAATIDLYPTLVELCNPTFRQTHFPLDGISLVPILRHERARVRDHVNSYWRDAVSVRTDTHRLIAKMKDGRSISTELYDVSTNPDSTDDLDQLAPDVRQRMLEYVPR